MNNQQNNEIPKWLEEQQHNSWQVEILIAGGFIFFFAQLPVYFKDFLFTGIMMQGGRELSSLIPIVTFGGYIFSRAILIGFAVNLTLRAIWVGFLGINFAFPKGIDYQRLNYSDFFHRRMKKGMNSVKRILQLEKLCSLSYSMAILITLMSIGIFFSLFILFYLIELFLPAGYNNPEVGFGLLFIIFMLKIGIVDELFFNLLKQWKWPARIYYPIHRILDWLTLSVLYKKEWVSLVSNSKRLIIYLIITVYFGISFLISITEMSEYSNLGFNKFLFRLEDKRDFSANRKILFSNIFESNYERNLKEDSWIDRFVINGPIVNGNILSIFIVYPKELDNELAYFMKENAAITERDSLLKSYQFQMKNKKLINKALNDIFIVQIDSINYQNLNWHYTTHPVTRQTGFNTFINIDQFARGDHSLKLDFLYLTDQDSIGHIYYYPTPFVKD